MNTPMPPPMPPPARPPQASPKEHDAALDQSSDTQPSSPAPPPAETGNDPYRAPDSRDIVEAPANDGKGSVGRGIAYFFLAMIFGGTALGAVVRIIALLMDRIGIGTPFPNVLLSLVGPIVAPLILGIWCTRKGYSRTAKGVWLGYVIVIGLVGLLVATCFGFIVSSGGLGNMH